VQLTGDDKDVLIDIVSNLEVLLTDLGFNLRLARLAAWGDMSEPHGRNDDFRDAVHNQIVNCENIFCKIDAMQTKAFRALRSDPLVLESPDNDTVTVPEIDPEALERQYRDETKPGRG
jgi:hypothetical protein